MEWCKGKKKLNSEILSSIENKDCTPQSPDKLKGVTKEICDHMTKNFHTTKLIVDNFNSEQIFQQIEILNSNFLEHYNQVIKNIERANVFIYEDDDDQKCLNDVVMHEDFFSSESANEEFRYEEANRNFENDEISLDENDGFVDENSENCGSQHNHKSAFELEQQRVKNVISNYEEALIKKQDWLLTGEVSAIDRPKDSLLNQETDFDVNSKPVLIEDEILNEKIEKAIKRIIKNKAFSDVERKFKPDIILYKKSIYLEQTKSKKSLSTVYEEEFLKKKYGEQEEENPKHVQIKKMMDSLLPEIQYFFNHVPKAAVPDIKIVSNLPAITVEEVAPTSVSDMALLAPEEVKNKTGLVKGATERNATDRKRERRQKKILQRKKFKEMKPNYKNPIKHRNTKIADVGVKIKSSKDFFNRLQEYTLQQKKM